MKRRLVFIVYIICWVLASFACSNSVNNTFINGNIEEFIEVNSVYRDKGVTYPADCTLIVDGGVDTTRLGLQKIKYSIFSADGSLKKEMYRFVTVVDNEPPTYRPVEKRDYYVGIEYTVDDFIAEYKDNYDSVSNLSIVSSELVFSTASMHEVKISICDSSNNITSYVTSVNVVLDVEKLILNIYKNQSYKLSTGTTGLGTNYISVTINSNASFTYFASGDFHYIENIKTELGSYATIQISANYGEFDKAGITFHVSQSISAYSVGFATIDATTQSVVVEAFDSTINNLNIDTTAMLAELNKNINSVLANFQKYMNETLHLALC